MSYPDRSHRNRRRPQETRELRTANQTGFSPIFVWQKLDTLPNEDEVASSRPRRNTDQDSCAITVCSQIEAARYEDSSTEGRDRAYSIDTNPWDDSLESPRDIPKRSLNPLAKEFIPKEHLISNERIRPKYTRISCAIKVEGCEIVGKPFVPDATAPALFSAHARPGDKPCLRLDFDFYQILEQPFDTRLIPHFVPSRISRIRLDAVNDGPIIEPFVPLTVRWYAGHVKLLGYGRAVEPPGDLDGDAEVIQLCPEDRLMERLIRMAWVSTSPALWPYNERSKESLFPDLRANLDALKEKNQSKEITIWFRNPGGLDATTLQELVPDGGLGSGS